MPPANLHNHRSSYRECVLEHLFVGELLRELWKRGTAAEILKPQVDDAGYDLVIEAAGHMRHIQLKSSFIGSKTANQKINRALALKPAGCVIWILFNEKNLDFCSFLWFGIEASQTGSNLALDLSQMKVAKHSRANAQGVKAERPNIVTVPKGRFQIFPDVASILSPLFAIK